MCATNLSLTHTYCQRWHASQTSMMTSNNHQKKLRILTPSTFCPGLCVTTVYFSDQSAQELAADIVHLTSAMTSAQLTVLGRAHIHSLTPLCHSLLANPSFPPFISISHPSITHHILSLSLGLSSSLSLGYCSFSEHLSLSFFLSSFHHLSSKSSYRCSSYSTAPHQYPHPHVPFPPSIHLAQGCQIKVLEESCPFKI